MLVAGESAYMYNGIEIFPFASFVKPIFIAPGDLLPFFFGGGGGGNKSPTAMTALTFAVYKHFLT